MTIVKHESEFALAKYSVFKENIFDDYGAFRHNK